MLICITLVIEMLVATSVHWSNGWLFAASGGGWEFPALLIVCTIVLALQVKNKLSRKVLKK
ncbi:hypothetical protein [Aquimarina algicola]|uniref:Uncharacterized protein n=1 Tax=Aquimarina algicola TaxID=2589995 RepID=A0A504J2C3_9FLAO|nr:hypothetical protein [Aquimarina algicola]TPN82765.1 hypothetical protein FHK87_20265 [Aquimarina algicola]